MTSLLHIYISQQKKHSQPETFANFYVQLYRHVVSFVHGTRSLAFCFMRRSLVLQYDTLKSLLNQYSSDLMSKHKVHVVNHRCTIQNTPMYSSASEINLYFLYINSCSHRPFNAFPFR